MMASAKTMRVGPCASKGKENIQTERQHHPDEIFLRRIELGLSMIRQKVKLRVKRCQELLEKLDKDSRQMRICFQQLMEVVENSKNLIRNEKQENMELLRLLDRGCTGKADRSSKTQTVNPMIGGLPLKRASISLKRLDPFQELHSYNNSRVILADSLPASHIGFSPSTSMSPLHRSIHSPQVPSRSEGRMVENSSSSAVLPKHGGKYRRWHEVHEPVFSVSSQDVHLKRASIHLKRLDPRSYLTERDMEEVLDSQHIPFEEAEVQSEISDSVCRAHSLENTAENEYTGTKQPVCLDNERKCKCLPLQSDPMVVLERLGPSVHTNSCSVNAQNSTSLSCSGSCSFLENSQTCDVGSVCEENAVSEFNCEASKIDNQQIPQDNGVTLPCLHKKRRGRGANYEMIKNHLRSNKINSERRAKKTGTYNRREENKKRKQSATNKKDIECRVPDNESNANHSEKKVDEDPLEGPSWLYKHGVVKKAKLQRLKKIREDYLTSFYYLAPTIYSSTDESGDEINNKEKKTNKLRKRKQKRRS